MTTKQLPARHVRTTTVPVDPRGPGRRDDAPVSPLLGTLLCLPVLAGGALAAWQWLQATCPTAPADLAQLCSAL